MNILFSPRVIFPLRHELHADDARRPLRYVMRSMSEFLPGETTTAARMMMHTHGMLIAVRVLQLLNPGHPFGRAQRRVLQFVRGVLRCGQAVLALHQRLQHPAFHPRAPWHIAGALPHLRHFAQMPPQRRAHPGSTARACRAAQSIVLRYLPARCACHRCVVRFSH